MTLTTAPATVSVTLGSESYELVPTVAAMHRIGTAAHGFVPVVRAVRDLLPTAMALVIAAGLGTSPDADEAILSLVLTTGCVGLAEPIERFVVLCANGGRLPMPAQPGAASAPAVPAVRVAGPEAATPAADVVEPDGPGSTVRH